MDQNHPIPMAHAIGKRALPAPSATTRRPIAVGTITRRGGRTATVRITEAGVTGSIRPTGGAR